MADLAALIERVEKLTEQSREVAERFVAKVTDGENGCWEWTACKDRSGRGRFGYRGKPWIAHRVLWTWLHGDIPAGKMLCHHCDNAGCLNPDHIYLGTHADNMRDMSERGRSSFARYPKKMREVARRLGSSNTWARGSQNPKARLTPAQVAVIRDSAEPTKALAARYGVNRTTIQRIRRGTAWTS